MDIFTNIGDTLTARFAGAYLHATMAFGVDPLEASARKQRTIRRWVCQHYIEPIHELPKDVTVFSNERTDQEVLAFLKACVDAQASAQKQRDSRFEQDFARCSEAARAALKQLMAIDFWPEIRRNGEDVTIITDDTPAFRRTVTLKNADAVPWNKDGCHCQNLGMVFNKAQGRFCFYGELEDPVEETLTPFGLTFENADVQVQVFNSCSGLTFWEHPWDLLRTVSFAIGKKAELPGDYCNEKERELLPLIKEIVALEYWMELPHQERQTFPCLKDAVCRYGLQKAQALLATLETVKPGEKAYLKTVSRLLALLCDKTAEPLWREVYDRIAASQVGYFNKTDVLCDSEWLASVRKEVQTHLHAKGYTGTYPDFIKEGSLDGIHLEQSYGMTYFVGMEKRVQYHIRCAESVEENGYLSIQFLCGTALLKKGEEKTDIFGCLFNAKGRRLFHTVYHYIPVPGSDMEQVDDIDLVVAVAVKKAECMRLTKAEQKEYYGQTLPGFGAFFSTFMVAGGLFGVTMTLAIMIICVIVTALFGMFREIPKMLIEMPWGMLLAVAWIGFGGAMGITEVMVRRK